MQKILTVIGARPQFIKASVVSREIKQTEGVKEILLHTGQHFDENMSDIFFNQLDISRPDIQLNVNGGTHGEMTGKMLIEIEQALIAHNPDWVLVYGDTNSTLAGALAAAKLHIPVAHVEAGLRSFNMNMPEEINRILTDQISDILFCPTNAAMKNLKSAGFGDMAARILQVGDVMQDSALLFAEKAIPPSEELPDEFVLVTMHRAENTDSPERLCNIVAAINEVHQNIKPVVLPLHPRTKSLISKQGLTLNAHVIDPVGYLEMVWLLDKCQLVLTDSGGVQKEAFFFGKACVTMRDQTEWVELVELGVNELVGADVDKIIFAVKNNVGRKVVDAEKLYGGGQAAKRIVEELVSSAL